MKAAWFGRVLLMGSVALAQGLAAAPAAAERPDVRTFYFVGYGNVIADCGDFYVLQDIAGELDLKVFYKDGQPVRYHAHTKTTETFYNSVSGDSMTIKSSDNASLRAEKSSHTGHVRDPESLCAALSD